MSKFSKDIELGTRFGMLTVLGRSDLTVDGHTMWIVQCDCGNKKIVKGSALRTGMVKSCGCLKEKNKKKGGMIGKKFGHLTVLEPAGSDKDGNSLWKVKCDCGETRIILGRQLRRGQKTCGKCSCAKDLKGFEFGKLVVLGRAEGKSRWLCKCSCGRSIIVSSTNLKKGEITSCGCNEKSPIPYYKQQLQHKNFEIQLGCVSITIPNPFFTKSQKYNTVLSEDYECSDI